MELLLDARKKSHQIPEFFIQRGIQWLRAFIDNSAYEDKERFAALAYAHYVLASVGQGKVEEARYFAKQYALQLPSLLAYAQLAQALELMGETKLAEQLLGKVEPLKFQRKIKWRDYGSRIRDMAGFAALVGNHTKLRMDKYQLALQWIAQAMQGNNKQDKQKRVDVMPYLSTQEQAWLVRFAMTLGDDSVLQLSLDNHLVENEKSSSTSLVFKQSDLFKPKQLRNQSDNGIWVMSAIYGQPIQKKLHNNGFEIEKNIYSLSGQEIDLQNIKQGERLIVVLRGRASTGLMQRPILVDLLPAGFEIENANLAHSAELARLNWLPELTAVNYSEALDDRYIAAFDLLEGKRQTFTLAYPVQAVSPGSYGLPGAEIEDMYQAYFRANTQAGTLNINAY